MPAGYSGTPLPQKLGIRAGSRVHLISAPSTFRKLLTPMPAGVTFGTKVTEKTDIIHLFASRRAALTTHLATLRQTIRPDAAVWVSWPKKASGVATDITEDVVRAVALPMGLVDVKVCAVDDTWSGLKLVVRKELR